MRSSGGAAGVLIALGVAPAFLFGVGGLGLVVVGDVVEHEAAAFAVAEHAAFAANAFGDEDAADADGPDHAGGVKLDELHVEEFGAGAVGEGVAVTGVFPTVAGDFEGTADAAGGEDDGLGGPEDEVAFFAVVAEGAGDAAAVDEEAEDGTLHVHIHAAVDAVILEGADHFEAGAIADVGEAGVAVAAEVALEDFAVVGAIEEGAPGFEFADTIGGFAGVEFGHAPVVEVLAAAHGVGEVDAPTVAVVDVGHGGGDTALGHDGVGFAEERLADNAYFDAGGGGLDRGAQTGAARANDQDVVGVGLEFRH